MFLRGVRTAIIGRQGRTIMGLPYLGRAHLHNGQLMRPCNRAHNFGSKCTVHAIIGSCTRSPPS